MTLQALGAAHPAASPPWPLAVGVLLTASDVPVRARGERRLLVALDVYRLGYYLLDLLEVYSPTAPSPNDPAWIAVEELVVRSGADALVIAAHVPAMQLPRLPESLASLPLRLVAA